MYVYMSIRICIRTYTCTCNLYAHVPARAAVLLSQSTVWYLRLIRCWSVCQQCYSASRPCVESAPSVPAGMSNVLLC
jgi:hypothetical protein